ncbi:superantigen-like protein [Staphylococcus aureus]|uniref:exotoxin beta-grasp domain-containing protein n=1 Tax=Staphylococcus aureus TaxID=1280 RepID=UPI0013C6FD80|nr:exotoxin beta-grasp domain-containing protein [Staphylococcus aureus]NEE99322.1 superantigen-like protein [Staphylococcus aureus]
MKKNIMNKLVLSTALLLLGTTSTQLPKTPISFSSEAKAYNISENETNINELIKYYTQPHLSLSNKWLWQKPNGSIHATLQTWVWYSHIQVFGSESWGNINQLRNKSDKPYRLFLKYSDKQQTIIGGHEFYKGNKPVLTLKELDFRIRQTLIKNKKLYNGEFNKGQIKITADGNNYTIDLSKKLKLTDTNRYVKNPKNAQIEVILEKSN